MPSRMLENPLVLPILGLLAERSMHPYLIEMTLRERSPSNGWPVNRGSLNSVVSALNTAGWVEKAPAEEGTPASTRTVYALTSSGFEELGRRVVVQIRDTAPEFSRFLGAAGYLGAVERAAALDALDARLRSLEESIAALTQSYDAALADGLPRLTMIETEGALQARAAERDWVESVLLDIRSGELEWTTKVEIRQ